MPFLYETMNKTKVTGFNVIFVYNFKKEFQYHILHLLKVQEVAFFSILPHIHVVYLCPVQFFVVVISICSRMILIALDFLLLSEWGN